MSAEKLLLLAVFVQVALTFGLVLWLGAARVPLVSSGKVRVKTIAIDRGGWPDHTRQLANAFDNQFQLPVLFYLAVVLTLWRGSAGWLEAGLALAFVALRLVHAVIHTTDNHVQRRFFAYTAGLFVLMAYWLVLAVQLVAAP